MPHAHGKRARTRDLFSKPYKTHGMPQKYYHGKTGVVFNITKTSVGVVINKKVRSRLIPKRIHIRIEHVRKSQSREAFVARVRQNDKLKEEAKKKG